MDKLKRYRHGARNGVMTPDPEGPFVRYEDVAAALEAAMEDAERYRWLRDKCDRWDGGLVVAEVTEFSLSSWSGDDLNAAIDRARGKAGQEVGNG